MIKRKITNAVKDEDGNIVALANPAEWWSPRSTAEIINDIEEAFYEYYLILNGQKIQLKVTNGTGRKQLRTDPNLTDEYNLVKLLDFSI